MARKRTPSRRPTRTRLSFAEFDAKLKAGALTAAEHRRYLEVNPASDPLRVRFKRGALRDSPPPLYDVDKEVYLAERAKQERHLAAISLVGLKRVVAEGDSWFNLPPVIRPQAIADRLKSNNLVAVKNIAKWGHTLAQMLARKEYLEEIFKFDADWFILSGGGNDLQEELKQHRLVYDYSPERPIDDCFTQPALDLLQKIAEGYRTLLNEIAVRYPNLPIVCYAYDYPRPTYKDGKYIGQYLRDMGYPRTTWDAVVKVMIDKLTNAVQPVVTAFPNARFLECRRTTAGYPFYDDMHPDTDAFKVLAKRFERALGVANAAAARSSRRRTRPGLRRKR